MQIRLLNSHDAIAYRNLRLQALKESPTAFASSYEREARLSLADFTARVCPRDDGDSGVFGAFCGDFDKLIGMLRFSRESRPKRAHIGSLRSMYVLPEFRGRGVGAALVDEAISHARRLGIVRQIVLSVTANNLVARSLYKSRGFESFGLEREALFVNGTYFDEEHLVLHFDRSA